MSDKNQVGKIGWIDITVEDADGLRDFYKEVVEPRELSGGQFCVIKDPSGATAALFQP
ncbi:MAG: hypothetical protein WBN05_10530 [Woeseiaceae bacterium]